MEKLAGVYQIKNKINGHIYIGSSVNMVDRLWNHKTKLRNQTHKNPHLQAAWNKYGEENFEFTILETVQRREDAVKLEQKYIDTFNPDYNIATSATATRLGIPMSDDAKKKLSKVKLIQNKGKNNPFYGKTHTKETRKKISEYRSGRKLSDKHRESITRAQMGEKSHYSKLTWDKVNELRMMYESNKYSQMDLVRLTGMSQSAINKLLNYKTWRIEV